MSKKNNGPIAREYPFTNIFADANGVSSDRAAAPIIIAWKLEDTALQSGWQIGHSLGTESELIAQFGVSRDTLREAIRVMEARGSMQMKRGRLGGLRLLRPCIDDVAVALAAYLQASGCGAAELAETASVASPVLEMLDDENLITSLFRQTMAAFHARTAPGTRHSGRAGVIAAQMTQDQWPIPEHGIRLGDEAELCMKFNCTRATLREALHLLGDLAMIKVQRGRGGGSSLIRPTPDATVRRIFGLIAARHFTMREMIPSLWALNLIRFRLAVQRLRGLDDATRHQHCDMLASNWERWPEPKRWYNMQRNFSRIADSKIISAMSDSVTSYLSRLGPTGAKYDEIDASLREPGNALIQALRREDYTEAERMHLYIHDQIASFLSAEIVPRKRPGALPLDPAGAVVRSTPPA